MIVQGLIASGARCADLRDILASNPDLVVATTREFINFSLGRAKEDALASSVFKHCYPTSTNVTVRFWRGHLRFADHEGSPNFGLGRVEEAPAHLSARPIFDPRTRPHLSLDRRAAKGSSAVAS
jgi:hypothetical protein